MGSAFDSMCSCEKKNVYIMGNSEIMKDFPKEASQTNQFKTISKSKELKSSLQNSSKITQFLSPNKIEDNEEENNLLNTAKNTNPSNNALSNGSNPQNNSFLINIPLESIQIENNNSNIIQEDKKNENNIFGQISLIEDNKTDKKALFNRESENSLSGMIKIFNKEAKNNSDISCNNNDKKEKTVIIDYNGEKCIFTGEIDDNKQLRGEGILKFENGIKIEGNFLNWKLNGLGKYTDEEGNYYEGIFDHGILNGNGKIIKIKDNNKDKSLNSTKILINKIIYTGNIKNFKKEGFGKEVCAEYIYEGNFHNDMKDGKGKMEFINNGEFYEGEFFNDKITGYGHYIWPNKHEYIGDFKDGEMNGIGKYKWPDGSEYEGEYINNKREGKGIFKWSNGTIFEGQFHDGKPYGQGIITPKGKSFSSEFKNVHFKNPHKEKSKK